MRKKNTIYFNLPFVSGNEIRYIKDVIKNKSFQGNHEFTKKCNFWIENNFKCKKAIITNSCTNALEMISIILNIKEGDEVIMPSYTFVSTANSFVLRGATPVFVDIHPLTLNINEDLIEAAITHKTKAIVVVHYAGVSCDMRKIVKIARKYKLKIIEDAAQSFHSEFEGKQLGTIGDLGAFSFHETKNIMSGEGGSLLINKSKYSKRAEIIRDKGTNRSSFLRGEIDKYTWKDIGSSFLTSELTAAFLYAQLQNSKKILNKRLKIWNYYHKNLKYFEDKGLLSRFYVPKYSKHNAHMYYFIISKKFNRNKILSFFKSRNIFPTFHYIPLHSSPAGKKYGKVLSTMNITNGYSKRLIRLPLYPSLAIKEQNIVLETLNDILI